MGTNETDTSSRIEEEEDEVDDEEEGDDETAAAEHMDAEEHSA
jgi:hypothetical protein